MAANDGQRLAVFGLSMREHHTLKMQQVLREYKINLPPMPSNRAALYLALFELAKELDEEEARGIENWLTNGGPFPSPSRNAVPEPEPEPIISRRRGHRYHMEDEEGHSDDGDDDDADSDEVMGGTGLDDNGEEWQEYDEETFNQAPVILSDSENERENANHAGQHMQGTTQNNANGSETTIRREEIAYSESESSDDEEVMTPAPPPPPRNPYPARGGYRGGYGGHRRALIHQPHDMEIDNDNENDTTVDEKDAGSSTPQEKELECDICADSLPLASFATKNITSTCNHEENDERRACFSCIQESIAAMVSEGALHRLNCVFCPELFSKSEVKQYGSSESYNRYEYLLLLANPSITMCLNPHCNSGQVHTDPDNPKMICKECSFTICALHKVPFHEGLTCAEFDQSETAIQKLEEAEATAKLLASDESKICPSCGECITRTEGCDHLMCRCGQEWCFLCLASWDNIMRIGETAHASTCPNNPNHQGTGRLLSRNPNTTANNPRAQELTTLIHGGAISPALAEARTELNHRRNARIRVEAREAAEKRMRAMEASKTEEMKNEEAARKRRKIKLAPAWEEGGVKKRSF